jgi:mono/diheme cytochrome c family protein
MKLICSLSLSLFFFTTTGYSQTPAASYALCAACHGPDGKGLNAGGPIPMAPPLAGSKLVMAGDGELAASIIFTGIAKEDAKYLGMMAPLGAMMKDEDMAAVLTFVRSNFGNAAPAVTADQVKIWREKYNGKPMQKRAELEKQAAQDPAAKP